MSSTVKTGKRPQHKSKGSDLSVSSGWSTSTSNGSTSLYNWPYTDPPVAPKKPWAVEALKELGIKVKGTAIFKKGKEIPGGRRPSICKGDIRILGREDLEDFPDDDVMDISEVVVAATKEAILEKEEELDLLPDFPEPKEYRMAHERHIRQTSYNHHRPLQGTKGSHLRAGSSPDLRATCRRSGSTPDLLVVAARRDSVTDPFYLEDFLKKFPKPPNTVPQVTVSQPEECSVIPRSRCSSDASLSTAGSTDSNRMSGFGKHKPSSVIWMQTPPGRDTMHSHQRSRLASKASLPLLPHN